MSYRALGWLLLPFLLAETAGAQGTPAEPEVPAPVLPQSDINALRKLLQEWYKADVEATAKLNEADRLKSQPRTKGKIRKLRKEAGRLRDKARRAKQKFREGFVKKGEKLENKDLLGHIGDLIAIFDGCFPYDRKSNGGVVKQVWINKKAELGYAVRFPKTYKPGTSWPLIYVLPAREKGGDWIRGKDYLERAWPKTHAKSFGEYIVVCPNVPSAFDLGAQVDPTKEDDNEAQRRNWFLTILGSPELGVFNDYQIDTDRVYLEATGEVARFALRIATLFPDRFGGLILKNPEVGELDGATMLQNLNQTGVLVVHNASGKEQADALVTKLRSAGQENVVLKEATGQAPFAGNVEDAVAWLEGTRRNLFKRKVVLVPTHDRFRKAYWVEVTKGDYLSQIDLSLRPQLEVTADRETNRIEIKGRGISEVQLLLNDLLVDLDKKVTLVLNGQVKEIQRSRSLPQVSDAREGLVVLRNDPRFLFVARGRFALPQPKSGQNAEGEQGGNDGAGK